MQGTPFELGNSPVRDAWVREHFQLTSAKVQAKLQRYLQMPYFQQEMPEDVSTEAAQLSWMIELATKAFSDWVHSLLNDLTDYNITANHQQVKAAAEVVDVFRLEGSKKPKQQKQAKPAGKKRGRPGEVPLLCIAPFSSTEYS